MSDVGLLERDDARDISDVPPQTGSESHKYMSKNRNEKHSGHNSKPQHVNTTFSQ